jgi:ribosomal-protein-serine acetyltransferase
LPGRRRDRHHRIVERPRAILTHEPVTLRRWRAADADLVYRAVTESIDHLRPWMPWAADYDRSSAADFLRQCEQDWDSGAAFNYAIISGGDIAGSCGLMARIGPGGLEIGYWVHSGYTRRGLATAAAAALAAEAFTIPGIDRVEIVHDAANVASGGIPRKLGFTMIGRRPPQAEQPAGGEDGTDVVWRLTRRAANS